MRFRDRLMEISSRAALLFATLIFCLWMMSSARADAQARVTDVRADHKAGAHEVTIELSQALSTESVKVDNQRNFIQVSLQGASAIPARNSTVTAGAVNKVFAYQYQPDLARVRLIMDRSAAEFQGNTTWKVEGNRVLVRFGTAHAADTVKSADAVKTRSASAIKSVAKGAQGVAPATPAASREERDFSAEAEARIVKEILEGKAPKEEAGVASKREAAPPAAGSVNIEEEPVFSSAQQAASGAQQPRSAGETAARQAGRMGAGLLLVLALLGLAAMGLKRFQQLKHGAARAGGGRILETIASHSLGAKRQLTLVKAADQYLVLGVTDHSVNLVTVLPKSAEIEKSIDEIRAGGGGFESMLAGKLGFFSRKQAEEAFESDAPTAPVTEGKSSVRDIIKKRMEGFKPLY